MILFEILQTENHPAYQNLSIDNLERQYDFLRSIIGTAVALQRPMLSSAIIRSLNMHAVACLHVSAGEYRPCRVTVGDHQPPDHFRIPELMEAFINEVNHSWERVDGPALGAYVLWKLNYIHPFINGNGRTARALCYYVISVRAGGILPGEVTLPELIRRNRDEYVELLRTADRGYKTQSPNFLQPLHTFIVRLLEIQLGTPPPTAEESGDANSDNKDA